MPCKAASKKKYKNNNKNALRNFVDFTGKTPVLESLSEKHSLLKRDYNTGVFL